MANAFDESVKSGVIGGDHPISCVCVICAAMRRKFQEPPMNNIRLSKERIEELKDQYYASKTFLLGDIINQALSEQIELIAQEANTLNDALSLNEFAAYLRKLKGG